ncbi:MAG: hypothetical protein Q9225_001183 [Loekoesia sp. 1 TL-2023]
MESPSFLDDPVDLRTLVGTMIFRDPNDVPSNPAAAHRRRRIEWPSLNSNLPQLITQNSALQRPPPHVVAKVKEMLDDEFAKCDIKGSYRGDEEAISYYYFQKNHDDFGPLLKLLYWRGRQQSAIYDLYEQLCMRGYIQAHNVGLPMSITKESSSVQSLTWLLECFEGPAKLSAIPEGDKVLGLHDDDFSLPLQWLATMVVRSSTDITGVLQTIRATYYLGDVDKAKFEEYMQHCLSKRITCNPQEGRCEPNLPSRFGFWLPHGVRTSPEEVFIGDIRKSVARFNRIEECFQEWFGLQPDVIYTEAQQVQYYETDLELLP